MGDGQDPADEVALHFGLMRAWLRPLICLTDTGRSGINTIEVGLVRGRNRWASSERHAKAVRFCRAVYCVVLVV